MASAAGRALDLGAGSGAGVGVVMVVVVVVVAVGKEYVKLNSNALKAKQTKNSGTV